MTKPLLFICLLLAACNDQRNNYDVILRNLNITHAGSEVTVSAKGGEESLVDGSAFRVVNRVTRFRITWITHEEAEKNKYLFRFEPMDKDGNQPCVVTKRSNDFSFLSENDDWDCDGGYYVLELIK